MALYDTFEEHSESDFGHTGRRLGLIIIRYKIAHDCNKCFNYL